MPPTRLAQNDKDDGELKIISMPQRCFSLFILFIMITNIVTLSDRQNQKVLIKCVLKINHIIINQIIYFISIINGHN
jgi:hypothetical protein